MRIRRALDAIRIERLRRSLKYEGLFSAAKIARLKNTRVYLTANIVDYMCAIAHQCNSLRELIFSQLLHLNEDMYLKCYETMEELKEGIRYYFNYYNSMRLHQGLDYEVPDDMYQSFRSEKPDRNMVLKYTLNKLFFCIDKRAQYETAPSTSAQTRFYFAPCSAC